MAHPVSDAVSGVCCRAPAAASAAAHTAGQQIVTVLLVNGAALKFASPDGDDLRHLIEFMMDGLKQRSVHAIAADTTEGARRRQS